MEKDEEEFRLTVKMVKEHQKLYNFLMVSIYILCLPFVIIYILCDKLGEFADLLGNTLSRFRMFIIKQIFKFIYKK